MEWKSDEAALARGHSSHRPESKKSPDVMPIDRIPMDERRRFFIKIVMLMRVDMRELFGMEVANRWGFWVDKKLSRKIRDFADWLDYPKGDHVLEENTVRTQGIVISDQGHFLFTGDESGMIKVWNMEDYQMIREWKANDEKVNTLAFQSGLLVSGSSDCSIKIWDTLRDYQLVHTLEGHTYYVARLDINAMGTQLVSASGGIQIRVWSMKTGECIRVMKGHMDGVMSVKFIGDLILSSSADGSMRLWDPSDGKQIQRVTKGMFGFANDVSVNCDASIVACLSDSGLSLFTWPGLKSIRKVDAKSCHCVFHPIHPHILAVTKNHYHWIEIFDVTKYKVIRTFKGHTDVLYNLCFSPDGSRMVSVSQDKSVRIWDVSDL